jgi:hypothetical protein
MTPGCGRSFVWALLLAAAGAPAADTAPQADATASSPRRGNVLTLRKPASATANHGAVIAPFVRSAAAGDVDAMFKAFDEVPVRANGESAIRQFLASEVVPFFIDASRLDDAMRVTTALFEDGTEGHMAYAYVVTAAGQARPFVIAWRSGTAALRVMDLQLGRCVASRHPVSPGHCDR